MTALPPAPPAAFLVQQAVEAALAEDLGRAGDLTSTAIIPPGTPARAVFAARQTGILAGLDCARHAIQTLDPKARIDTELTDGAQLHPGSLIATVHADARALLAAERTALNFMSHLSGVASATAELVALTRPHKARIVCTRKTTPGLRSFEKYAVRCGGGHNHRFGLDDGILIKDNHIAIAGGVRQALERARQAVGHMVKIEIEVDTLDQLHQALDAKADAVLLDNMGVEMLAEAVKLIGGRAEAEASGRINRETVGPIAATGVDLISCGWITHSAPILDIGLDID